MHQLCRTLALAAIGAALMVASASIALAQDSFDLADALGLGRFAIIGHDWGARAAYIMAALAPERISAVSARIWRPKRVSWRKR